MTKAQIYRKAAKIVAKEKYNAQQFMHKYHGCCYAIDEIADHDEYKYKSYFKEIFYPRNTTDLWWMGARTKENALFRSLALLFMAEMES